MHVLYLSLRWAAGLRGLLVWLPFCMLMLRVTILWRCVWGWSWVLYARKCLGTAATGSMSLVTGLLARLCYHKLMNGKPVQLAHSWPSVVANLPCTCLCARLQGLNSTSAEPA